MSEELKPCPFCGQQEAFVEQLDSDASVVICQGMVDEHSACLARGPVGVQEDEREDQPGRDAAIAAWNDRAQPAVAEVGCEWEWLKLAAEVAEEDGPWEPRLGMTDCETAFAQSASPTRVLELIASLSAVTAERDSLREEMAELWKRIDKFQSQSHGITALAEIERLRAEVEALRKAVEPLEPVHGDALPPIGSKVLIHLSRSDAWVEHTVAGYYAWGDLEGDEYLHRVFVRVRDSDGYLNARLLKDVRPVDAAMAAKEA